MLYNIAPFDGLSAMALSDWLQQAERLVVLPQHDHENMLFAVSQTLPGPAERFNRTWYEATQRLGHGPCSELQWKTSLLVSRTCER